MRRQFCISMILIAAAANAVADDEAEHLFVRRIQPLLSEKCWACHGNVADDINGGLNLQSLAGLLEGGESGMSAIVPGKPNESPLYLVATREHDEWSAMPPKEADKLNLDQIGWIREWITKGAAWPNAARIQEISESNAATWSLEDGVRVQTSGGLSNEWTTRRYQPDGLWAYQTVNRNDTKGLSRDPGQTNPVDGFIAASMPTGLQSAPDTDARAFIRRATFDLIGLPPTPDEIKAFQIAFSRDSDSAVSTLIDRLLDSPHYGERMAQHWLDVTRYADSSGFSNDYERGNAWRYRDYVVRSFNIDKPYDQFVKEQIAGDEIAPANPEMMIATGFLRMGPWELTGMEVAKIARQRFLDDVTNSVGETFLAHSLQCARCHDHKFDPIPTRDYYSVQAVFATTQLAERAAAFLPNENVSGFEERKFLDAAKREHERRLQEVTAKTTITAARDWLQKNGREVAEFENAVNEIVAQKKLKDSRNLSVEQVRQRMQKRKVHPDLIPPRYAGFAPEDFGNERIARKGIERLRWEFERYEPFALSVYNGGTPQVNSVNGPVRVPENPMTDGELEVTCVLNGGDPFGSGEAVKPGVLSVLGTVQQTLIPDTVEGRRKAFADWVANERNPLTTRAIVNRIWMWHFGEPIAGNPNNFGSTGKRPTHPELLDWLAAALVEQDWSIKDMHRVIMTSKAYRRSTHHPDLKLLKDLDPGGTSYAVFKPRRLSAEELRDAMLATSGELNPTLGGIPNRPDINHEAALQPRQVMGTFAAAWVPNPRPSERNRRSLYALKLRGLSDPAMEVFNSPSSDFSCERRETSTVSPQVFAMFNSQASHSRALALAARVLRESKNDDTSIIRCFQLVYGRPPETDELEMCLNHWRGIEELLKGSTPATVKQPLEVLREAVEENTGENFSFLETLHGYAEFVPDLQPSDCDPHTRALADICLALFNSNEFAYVY